MLAQVDRGEHAGESTAHDRNGDLLDHRVPSKAGLDERISVQLLEFVAQVAPLGHSLGTQALLPFLPVPLRNSSVEGCPAPLPCSIAIDLPVSTELGVRRS